MRHRHPLCPIYQPRPRRDSCPRRSLLYTLCLVALFELPQILASWITVWSMAHPPNPQVPPPAQIQVEPAREFPPHFSD